MFEQEKENIKKIYGEMPPHLQSVVNIDNETFDIINGKLSSRFFLAVSL